MKRKIWKDKAKNNIRKYRRQNDGLIKQRITWGQIEDKYKRIRTTNNIMKDRREDNRRVKERITKITKRRLRRRTKTKKFLWNEIPKGVMWKELTWLFATKFEDMNSLLEDCLRPEPWTLLYRPLSKGPYWKSIT